MMCKIFFDGITKKYGNRVALDEFSFSISSGEIVGLIGKNGAGKTTLLNCIAANIIPDSGSIRFESADDLSGRDDIGVSIDAAFVDYLSGMMNLRVLAYTKGDRDVKRIDKRAEELMRLVDLYDAKDKKVSGYSYGMRQRLGFIQAIFNEPKFVFLDEPFAGLDINGRKLVKKHLKYLSEKNDVGILFSDHNLRDVEEICSRVICIQDGVKVYDGKQSSQKIIYINVEKLDDRLCMYLYNIGASIDRNKKIILVEGDTNINDVIRIIVETTQIVDISVSENTLDRFLREGD